MASAIRATWVRYLWKAFIQETEFFYERFMQHWWSDADRGRLENLAVWNTGGVTVTGADWRTWLYGTLVE